MNKILVLTAFTLLLYIYSCKGNQKKSMATNSSVTDTVTKDIPKRSDGTPFSVYSKLKELEKIGDFPSLEVGFDSLQIRIWYSASFCDSVQLITLKKINSYWSAELYSLKYNYDEKGDKIISLDKRVEAKFPKSGWGNFIEKLYDLKILTLPNAESLPGYAECFDGAGITIEVATLKEYRIYNYPCLGSFLKIWQCRNALEILELIESEFGFTRVGELYNQ